MSDANKHNDESLNDTRWASVIEELREWPSDASEWESDQVVGFVEQVRLLAEQKSDERKKAGRLHLQRALDQLREDYASEIVFFEFESLDIANWQAADCPTDEVSERTKTVESLLEQLSGHRSLNQQSPKNLQEARKHRTDLNDTEDRINSLAKQLEQEFAKAEPEPQQAPEEDTQDDDEPDTDPPEPGKGPSCEHPDSDEDQQAEKDARLPSEESKRETSSNEQDAEAEPTDKPEEPQSKPIQPTTSAPPPHEKKPPTLRSAQDVAALLQEDDSDEHWESLGWSLLAEGDLTGAYWLALSLKARGRNVPVAPELLAVLQGSHWLEGDDGSLVHAILEIVSDWAPRNNAERMLGLAAAMRPCLIAPHAGLVGWLPQRVEINSTLDPLVDAIRTFTRNGFPLRSEDLQGVENQASLTESIRDTVEQARRLLANYQGRRLKIRRATNVLRSLVDQGGDLRVLLTPVIDNQANHVDQIRHSIDDFRGRKIEERIHQIDRELRSSRPSRPITGVPRDQLVRSIEVAVALADQWCSLVEREQFISNRGDWWSDHVKVLRDQVHTALPSIKTDLDRNKGKEKSQEEAAWDRVLQHAIDQVTVLLGLKERPDIEDPQAWMQRESGSLKQALARRLLWLPEVSLDDDGFPGEDQEADIATFLRQSLAEERELNTACAMQIEGQDFRFAEILRSALSDDEERQVFEDRIDEALKGARAALKEKVANVRGAIEQGMVDGLLVEKERTDLSDELEKAAIEEPLCFGPLFRRLDDVEQQLNRKRADRLQELEVHWTQIRQTLEPRIQVEQLKAAEAFIHKAFQQSDTRVVDEGLAHLREVLKGEIEWESAWFDPPYERNFLKEFQDASPGIESGLTRMGSVNRLAGLIESGNTWGKVAFGELPKTRRDETALAIKSWHLLKRHEDPPKVAHRHVPVLLAYLGFHLLDKESTVDVKSRGRDWLHREVDASASDLTRPIPQLGSQANGCYNVVCLWERPGAASIGAFLRDLRLDTKTVIVFFLGRLSQRRRRDISARAVERNLALVVLDEVLLVFLARLDDTRLPAFLRCSLPYAALNPYTPFQAGNVPPEMYYGRDEMVRQLQYEGNCIVFGGRQLGKSALLRQVERTFHQPNREQFAWVDDIKLVGDALAGEQPEQLWIKLRDGFKKHALIRDSITAIQPDNIIKHIQNALDETPQRRVLVLFDEADSFLGADAQNGFQVVERLRSLMQDTQSRFKVVFAGLHNVQRFNDIPNQPLAHFGENLLVGPLEASSARDLVREPLETLGYRFVDETTVLKVLSYTNYHPGLIQYFCYELVRRLQTRRPTSGPPYKVNSEDVEAVYRSPQARQVIRERLDWTLALDPRYQCIAWAMIYDQKEARDSYVRSFSVTRVLELAREYWPQGFDEVHTEALGGLLGEMVGLGILVHNQDENQYMLRSPNLVRLMGTEDDIEDRLLELSDKSQPTRFQPDSQHVLLEDQGHRYSPLTLVEEGRIQQTRPSGVSLVFGSQALGLDALDETFDRMGGSEIPAQELIQANRTCAWLDSHAKKQRGIEQLLTYGRLRGTGGDMAQYVWEVSKMCGDFEQRGRRPLRVVFILKPEAAWTWLRLPANQRIGLEDGTDSICLRRWNEVGIQQRLSQAEMLDSPEICQKVLEATGGWPFLLDDLLRRCSGHDNPRSHAKTLLEEVACPGSKLGSELLQQAGLESRAESCRILQTIVECDKVSEEDLETLGDLVEGTPPLTLEDCKLAVEFLRRMGCLEKRDGEYRVESVIGRIVSAL